MSNRQIHKSNILGINISLSLKCVQLIFSKHASASVQLLNIVQSEWNVIRVTVTCSSQSIGLHACMHKSPQPTKWYRDSAFGFESSTLYSSTSTR